MTSSAPVEVKVVYDASRRRRSSPAARIVKTPRRAGVARGIGLLALLNLAVAGAMFYVTWWRVNPFLAITMIKKTPMDVPPNFGSSGFLLAPKQRAPAPDEAAVQAVPSEPMGHRWGGKTAQWLIPTTAYGWLILAVSASCALGLAGGAGLGAAGGGGVRAFGLVLALALLGGLAYGGSKVWGEYKMLYKAEHLQAAMGGLLLLCALVGMVLGRRVRGLTVLAGACLILAATGSVAGMLLWSQSGALEPQQATAPILAGVFAAHSLWGWLLLITAARMR